MKHFLSFLLILLFLFNCSGPTETFEIKQIGEETIQDNTPYLGEIYGMEFISKDHFFTYDNRAIIKEFKNYEAVKTWGNVGKGPCEHGSLNNFIVHNNRPYLLDRESGKFLIYYTKKDQGVTCKEYINEKVPRLTGVQVVKDAIYFIRGSLQSSMTLDTPIIYKFNKKDSTITKTDVTLKDLSIKLAEAPIRLSMASDTHNGKIYFYLPLTKKVFSYNTLNSNLRSIDVNLYIAQDQNIYSERNMRKLLNLMGEIEMVFDLFVFDQHVALGYRKGTGKEQIWGLKVFNKSGEMLARKAFDNRVVYMKEGTLMTLNLEMEEQQDPYHFKIYEYSIR